MTFRESDSMRSSSTLALPDIASNLTRRHFLAGASSLLLLGAAGCGESDGGEDTTSDGARIIEHKYGTTEIFGKPERVVTVGDTDQDPVLALGVTPLAIRDWFGDQPYAVWPWGRDELDDTVPEVLAAAPQGLNFERIAGLEPDVIIGTYSAMTVKEYETLSQIAPTIAQSGEYPDYGQPWQEITATVGRVLGREERARRLIADIERRFDSARQAHPEFEGKSAVVGSASVGVYSAFTETDAASRFLSALGFAIPSEIEELASAAGLTGRAEVSEERLDLFDTDLLVWYETEDEGHGLLENPLYTRLDVYRQDRDIFMGYVPLGGALAFSTVLSLPFALDALVPMIAAAVDGDPETSSTDV